MIEVFFHGIGAWFIKDNVSLRLATNYHAKEVVEYDERMEPKVWVEKLTYHFPVINGVFALSDTDELIYRYTENFDHVKHLFPSSHPNSNFLKMVEEGKLSLKNAEHYYFEIAEFVLEKELTFVKYPHNKLYIAQSAKDNKIGYGVEVSTNDIDRNKTLLLIVGMAMSGYGYNPERNVEKNHGISSALNEHGIKICDEDIDHYLTEAYQLKLIIEEDGQGKVSVGSMTDGDRRIMFPLLLGMAIDCYDYKIGKRNKATGSGPESIFENIKKPEINIDIDDGTIKKNLDRASEYTKSKESYLIY